MKLTKLAPVLAVLAAPALAQDAPAGDAAAGETIFGRQCVSCHVIADADGNVIAGRNARTGPNLFGAWGRAPGTYPDFDYSDAMVAYGETGAVWDEATLVGYLQDPTGYLREQLDDRRARGAMAFQLRNEADAVNVAAYLATFAAASE